MNGIDSFNSLLTGKKKIAILVPNYSQYSGDARVADIQARDLIKNGMEVTIIALGGDMKPPEGAKIIRLGLPKNPILERVYKLLYPINAISILKLLKTLKKYDVLISHLYPMNWPSSLAHALTGKIYIFWYHGIPPPKCYPYLFERFYMRVFIFLTRVSITNADMAFSVSEYAKRELVMYAGKDSEVIYNRADISKFDTNFNEAEFRKKYGLGNDRLILSVGRLCPQKGFHLLVKAHKLILERKNDVTLVIVGKPVYDYYYQQLRAEADEKTLFIGYVDDDELSNFFKACDLYATCSLWETYNMPLVEAQQMGKSTVAFNIGPHSEVAGENCVLVNKGDLKKFSEVCVSILNSKSISKETTVANDSE